MLGVWSRSSKLFEVIYIVLWYLGPSSAGCQLAGLDYLGVDAEAPAHTAPGLLAAVIIALLLLAVAGRRQQMKG